MRWSSFILVPILIAFPVGTQARVQAQEPDRQPDLEQRLEATPLTFQLLETPARSALEHLGKIAGVRVIYMAPGDAGRAITLRARNLSARAAFRWVTYLAGLDFQIGDHAVLVGEPEEIARRQTRLAVYDIRDLVLAVFDDPAPALSFPSGDPEALEEVFTSDEPLAGLSGESLAEIITAAIEPESWDGEVRQVEHRGGTLFVTNTPPVLKRVAAFLADLRQQTSRTVEVEAHFLAVGDEIWSRLLTDPATGDLRGLLDAEQAAALLAQARSEQGCRILQSLRTLGRSGQRIHSRVCQQVDLVGELEVQVAQGVASAEPVSSLLTEGAVLDVRPVATDGGKSVILRLQLQMARVGELREVVYGPADGEPGSENVSLQLPVGDSLLGKTCLRVPAGGAAVLAASSPLAVPGRLVLLVKPRVVQREEGR